MNIGIISPYITAAYGPEEQYNIQAYGISKALANHGHEVDVYTVKKRNDPPERNLDVKRGRATIHYVTHNLKIPQVPLMNPSVVQRLTRNNPDIIQVSEYFIPTSYLVGMFRSSFGGSLVVYQGLYRQPSNSASRLYFSLTERTMRRMMNRAVDGVITKTTAAASFMRTKGYTNVSTIPVGVDTDVFRPIDRMRCRETMNWNRDDRIALFVGKLLPSRDISTCISAIAMASKSIKNLRLVIVGTGPDLSRLQRIAFEMGVADRIQFIPQMNNSEMPLVYNASDLTLLPMKRDAIFTYGMIIPESLGCGIPVIAAPVPGASDHVAEGSRGALVDFEDPKGMADAISEVLGSETKLLRMKRDARDYCTRFLDWSDLGGRFLDFYSCIGRKS